MKPSRSTDAVVGAALRAPLLVRGIVGAVFLSEGIQKFLFPAMLGAGRFTKIGLPYPDVLGPFVGLTEIVCGTWDVVARSPAQAPTSTIR
jgi:uncharacterized membrane protein YphA (DoxX/SURF4 family)